MLFLHTTVVMCGYLVTATFLSALTSLALPPLSYLINNVFLRTELLLNGCRFVFPHPSLQSLEAVACENSMRSAVSKIKPPCLAPTIIPRSQSQITFLPHSDIWSEKQLNLSTTSACFRAFSCCPQDWPIQYLH